MKVLRKVSARLVMNQFIKYFGEMSRRLQTEMSYGMGDQETEC